MKKVAVMVYADPDLKEAAKTAGVNMSELFNEALKATLGIAREEQALIKERGQLETKLAAVSRRLVEIQSAAKVAEVEKAQQDMRLAPYLEYIRKQEANGSWKREPEKRAAWFKEATAKLKLTAEELDKRAKVSQAKG